jgi:hypothetical protein
MQDTVQIVFSTSNAMGQLSFSVPCQQQVESNPQTDGS